MPRKRIIKKYFHLNEFQKGRIVGLCEQGTSTRKAATIVGTSNFTVNRIWNQWLKEGDCSRKVGSGRKKITSAREDRRIRRSALTCRKATARELKDNLAIGQTYTPSVTTISRRLHDAGIYSRRPLLGLPLTHQHKACRLEWCCSRKNWNVQWRNIIFSDESRFVPYGNDARGRVWRRSGERAIPSCIVSRHTARQNGIMVWGAICHSTRLPLVTIRGTLNAQRYVNEVLIPVVLPFLRENPGMIYQQDNARPHTAKVTIEVLNNFNILSWPARSPIENLWDLIGRQLTNSPETPCNLIEFEKRIKKAWLAIPQDTIDHLISSMPKRITECMASKGCWTSY